MKIYFKMYFFKSTFVKDLIKEYTFCCKVFLVATVTEFLSKFVTVIINIYIQQRVFYLPELKAMLITLYIFLTFFIYITFLLAFHY